MTDNLLKWSVAIGQARKEAFDIRHLYTMSQKRKKLYKRIRKNLGGYNRKLLTYSKSLLSRSATGKKSRWNLVCIIIYDAADEKETKREERELNELQKMSNTTTEIRVEMSDNKQFLSRKTTKWGELKSPSPR